MNEPLNSYDDASEQATRILDAMEKAREEDETIKGYELWLPGGLSLRLSKDFDPEELRVVIEKLTKVTPPLMTMEAGALAALFAARGYLPSAPKVIRVPPPIVGQDPLSTANIAIISAEPSRNSLGAIRDLLSNQGYTVRDEFIANLDEDLERIAEPLGFERAGEPNTESTKEAIECLAKAAGFTK